MHVLAYECMYLKVLAMPRLFACSLLFGLVPLFSMYVTLFLGPCNNTAYHGQTLGPHATLILYMNINEHVFPMEKVLSSISPVSFGLPFRSKCPLFKVTMIMDTNN